MRLAGPYGERNRKGPGVPVMLPAEVVDGMSSMDTGYAALLVAIAERCAADPRIRALVVSGSVARHDADRHSDLDLTLVVTEGRRAEVAADAVPLLQDCCEIVDLRWVGPRIVSAVTSQWLRVDLILAEATGDRCTLHGDHVVVFDNLGVEFGPPPTLPARPRWPHRPDQPIHAQCRARCPRPAPR